MKKPIDTEQYPRLVTAAMTQIERLQNSQRLLATWHTEHHVTLTNPATGRSVEFYPTRGTIVRDQIRQTGIGIDAALKLLGVAL